MEKMQDLFDGEFKKVKSGDFIKCKIISVRDYDLIGEII